MINPGITIVSESEVREVVRINAEVIAAVGAAFTWAAEQRVYSPPIMHIDVAEHGGDVDVKSAYIRGEAHLAIKIAAGFFDNPKLGLPSGSALVVLLNSQTGRPEMIFLDNGYLTDVRTAAAGAIAVRHLARSQDCRLGIIGSGAQARYQLRAIAVERQLKEVRVAGRSSESTLRYASEMAKELSLPVKATSIEDAVFSSDIVVTTTPSRSPILPGELLTPGKTIVAMGSDAPLKRELDIHAISKASLIVCDNRQQCEKLGELHHAINDRAIAPTTPTVELGEVMLGTKHGRMNDTDIVICDLTGMGAQDTAIGIYARRMILKNKLGWQSPSHG